MEVGYCESEYEAAMLDLLVSLGWTQSGGDELHRKYSDALILDDLRSFLQRRYPDFTPEELERIVFNLSNSGAATDYLALRATASLCVNGFVFSRDDLSLPNQHVDYIDFENPQDERFYYTPEKFDFYDVLKQGITSADTLYQWRRVYVRANKRNVCPTLTANMGMGGHNVPLILTPFGIRKLTPRECFNFMGFPATYNLPDLSLSQLYKQAGNSVAVPVVKRIADNIQIALE